MRVRSGPLAPVLARSPEQDPRAGGIEVTRSEADTVILASRSPLRSPIFPSASGRDRIAYLNVSPGLRYLRLYKSPSTLQAALTSQLRNGHTVRETDRFGDFGFVDLNGGRCRIMGLKLMAPTTDKLFRITLSVSFAVLLLILPDGARAAGETTGGSAADGYRGPCDVITSGCAEAYSVTRAMASKYTRPLFQLYNGTTTIDIKQTSSHTPNMSTWSTFCGGTMITKNGISTSSTCSFSKIYAQIHGHANDLIPSVFRGNADPVNCNTDGPYLCAAPFAIEVATGLPIVDTGLPGQARPAAVYTLSGDGAATGIPAGNSPNAIRTLPLSIMYNGRSVPGQYYCCGVFGLTHNYAANDTLGTDFMAALSYASLTPLDVNCATNKTYCVGSENESINDLADYGSQPVGNAIVSVIYSYSPGPSVTGYLNDVRQFVHSPPNITVQRGGFLNPGTSIHFGGGGDLSVADEAVAREMLITNTAMSPTDQSAAFSNMTAFYSGLSFPAP
jgi:Alpha-L-arabinofuranosidase B, catalytic